MSYYVIIVFKIFQRHLLFPMPDTLFPRYPHGCSLISFRSLLKYHLLAKLFMTILVVTLEWHTPLCQQLKVLAPFYCFTSLCSTYLHRPLPSTRR